MRKNPLSVEKVVSSRLKHARRVGGEIVGVEFTNKRATYWRKMFTPRPHALEGVNVGPSSFRSGVFVVVGNIFK